MAIDVTLYTRRPCMLCDKAKAAIDTAVRRHALDVTIREVNIDNDPELHALYTTEVPVIFVNGREAFRHRVSPEDFASYVEQVRSGALPSQSAALAREKCVPCRGGVPPLKGGELHDLAAQLGGGWRVVDEHHLEKTFPFPDFAQALHFTNRVGALAEEEGHHPDILLSWGKVVVTLWTHKINGLSRSDFVLAAKIDRIG